MENKLETKKGNSFWPWFSLFLFLIMVIGGLFCWREIGKIQDKVERCVTLDEKKTANSEIDKPISLEESSWYENMMNKIIKLDYEDNSGKMCQQSGSICIRPEHVSQVVYLADKKAALVLIAGSYAGSGFKLLKYDLTSGDLVVAKREDIDGGVNSDWYKKESELNNGVVRKTWFSPPRKIVGLPESFANDTADVFKLSGSEGDAGCWEISNYEYNWEENYVTISKKCSGCNDDRIEEGCVEY